MKVKELIQKLSLYNGDLDVLICDYEAPGPNCIGEVKVSENSNDYPEDWDMPDRWIEIRG